jgi:hypothetical protein
MRPSAVCGQYSEPHQGRGQLPAFTAELGTRMNHHPDIPLDLLSRGRVRLYGSRGEHAKSPVG